MKQMSATIKKSFDNDMNYLQTKLATSYPEFDPRNQLHPR